jgi:hypothetical protein
MVERLRSVFQLTGVLTSQARKGWCEAGGAALDAACKGRLVEGGAQAKARKRCGGVCRSSSVIERDVMSLGARSRS